MIPDGCAPDGLLQPQLHHETKILLISAPDSPVRPCRGPDGTDPSSLITYTTLLTVRTALAPDILHQHGICRHAGVDGKRKKRGLPEKKRYERAAGALLLDRAGTQWVPVSAASVQGGSGGWQRFQGGRRRAWYL